MDTSSLSPEEKKYILRAAYEQAVEDARNGDWRRYVRVQWPEMQLDFFQEYLFDGIFSHSVREVFAKGCTGCGKSASAGAAVVAYYDVWDDAKIVVASASVEHAKRVMFGEISKWFNACRIKPSGDLLKGAIYHKENHRLDVVNPESEEGFAGGHGMHTLFLFDEACHDEQTEVLTDRGWVLWGNVTGKEKFATLNPYTLAVSFQYAESIHCSRRSGPMAYVSNETTDFCVTPNHTMLYWDGNSFVRSELENIPCGLVRTPWKGSDSACFHTDEIKYRHYDGMVYCAHVPPHHTLLTRRNMQVVWSGNTSIADSRYDIADTQASKVLALGNPRTLFGRFRDAFPKDSPDESKDIVSPFGIRRCITISAYDCVNVKEKRLKIPVAPPGGIKIGDVYYDYGTTIPEEDFEKVKMKIPGQIDYGKCMGMVQKSDDWWVRVFVHAKFPQSDPDTMIVDPEWIDRHKKAWGDMFDSGDTPIPESFGLDVGGTEKGDPSVLTSMCDRGVIEQHENSIGNAPGVVSWVLSTIEKQYGIDMKDGNNPIAVDMDGLGWGVGTTLAEMGVWVIEIRGNASSDVDRTLYANKRAECYGELGKRLDPNETQDPFMIPGDTRLHEEICAPQKVMIGNDGRKFRITPKTSKGKADNSVKKMLGRSPDRGDSCVYAYRAQSQLNEAGIGSVQISTGDIEIDTSWSEIIPDRSLLEPPSGSES